MSLKTSNKALIQKIPKKHLPNYYHKLIIENENYYLDNPNQKNLDYLLYLYKIGIEFFSIEDITRVNPLAKRMERLILGHNTYVREREIERIKEKVQQKAQKIKEEKENMKKKSKLLLDEYVSKEKENKMKEQEMIEKTINYQHLLINKMLEGKKVNTYLIRRKTQKSRTILTDINMLLSDEMFKQAVYKTPRRKQSTPKIGDCSIRINFYNTDVISYKKTDKSEEMQKIIISFLRQFVYCFNDYSKEYINTLLKICDEEYKEKVQLNLEYFESMNEFGRMAPDDRGVEGVLSTLQIDFINDRNDLDKNTKDKVLSYIENQSKKGFEENLSFSSLISNTISDLLHEVC